MDTKQIRGFLSEFLKALSDVNFEHIVTTRMLPTIYMAGVVFAAILSLFLLSANWADNSWLGRGFWVVIFAPVLFVGLVTTWRVLLELCLSIFEMTVLIRSLHNELEKVSGVTDEIATDLPRIQFWRSRKSGRSGDNEKQ